MSKIDITEVFSEMIAYQQGKLLKIATEINSKVCEEDLLQPFDFPELENDPLFRYEEGILHGLISAQLALKRELIDRDIVYS